MTTTIRESVLFLESRRITMLTARVERALRMAGPALISGRVTRERYRALVRELRRKIDGLAETSRELMEAVE